MTIREAAGSAATLAHPQGGQVGSCLQTSGVSLDCAMSRLCFDSGILRKQAKHALLQFLPLENRSQTCVSHWVVVN